MTLSRKYMLDHEDQGWRALWSRFDRMSDDDWLLPGATGEWTPKDVLGHIACWHALATDELEVYRNGGTPTRSWKNFDEANVDFYDRCKDLSLHDVRVMSGASRHRFREEMGQAGEPLTERIANLIRGNAHEHYEEHLPDLDKFLEGR